MPTTRNRATGSTKRGLRSISKARLPVIVTIEESESDDLGELSNKMSLFINHPNARAIADRIQTTHGSSWEVADSNFAYNIIYVFSDAERRQVLNELKRDGLIVQFSEYPLPRQWIGSGSRGPRKSSYVAQKSMQRKLTRSNIKRRRNKGY